MATSVEGTNSNHANTSTDQSATTVVPVTSTGKPTSTTTKTAPTNNNKKKKSGGLFSCFGCGASDAFDDDRHRRPSRTSAPTQTSDKPVTKASGEKENLSPPLPLESNEKHESTSTSIGGEGGHDGNAAAGLAGGPAAVVGGATLVGAGGLAAIAATAATTHDSTATSTAVDTLSSPMDDSIAISPTPPTSSPSPQGVVLSPEETEGVTSGAVMAPGKEIVPTPTTKSGGGRRRRKQAAPASESIITQVPEPGQPRPAMLLASHGDESDEDDEDVSETSEDGEDDEDEEDEEQSLIARGGVGIPIGEDGLPHPLLDELAEDLKGRKCLVLDLDETLVHSSFKMVHQADYVVPVEIESQYHNVYVIKRPGVDAFLKAMGEIYEVVIFTASLSKYADPVLDQLDIHRVVRHRLFRESCYNNKGNYVKDLSQLGRPMSECIIIDNSPASYVFHVNNAVPISSWFNDPHDTELTDLVPFLTDLGQVDDIRSVLDAGLYQHLTSSIEIETKA